MRKTDVPEEKTPAPRQGLGVWIMSGSMALVMVIGGALAVNSGDKSVEEGNPTATRTVAPGGGHTIEADKSEDSADRSVTGEAGVLGVQLTQAGLSDRDSDIRQTVAPVLGGRASAPRLEQQAQGQTARADVGGATVNRGQPGAAPTVPQPDSPDLGVGAEAPDQVEILRAETGEELQVRFAVPTAPGSYAFPMSVDGTQFVVHVRVGEDGRVTVPSFDGASTPYHHDPVSGRLTVTVVPADREDADPALPPGPVASTSILVPHKTITSDESGHVSTAQLTVAAASPERAGQVVDEARVDGGTPVATGSDIGGQRSDAEAAPAEHGASTEESEAFHDHSYAGHSRVRDTKPTAVQSSSGENRSKTPRRTPGKPSSAGSSPTPRITTTSPRRRTPPHTAAPHDQRSESSPDRTAVQDDAGSNVERSPLGPPQKTS